jgi:hypothetical protein
MKAVKLFKRRVVLTPESFAELVVWEVAEPVSGSSHYYKYRLAFVYDGVCMVRYDNEAGKGDHKHINVEERSYNFKDIDTLICDFLDEIRRWQNEHSNS